MILYDIIFDRRRAPPGRRRKSLTPQGTLRPPHPYESGVRKGGFSKRGSSNSDKMIAHKLLSPPLLNPPL